MLGTEERVEGRWKSMREEEGESRGSWEDAEREDGRCTSTRPCPEGEGAGEAAGAKPMGLGMATGGTPVPTGWSKLQSIP